MNSFTQDVLSHRLTYIMYTLARGYNNVLANKSFYKLALIVAW